MTKKKPRRPPAARDSKLVVVDTFKRLHVAIALAPVFARAHLEGKIGLDHDDVAEALVHLATAIARRL